MPLDQVMEYSLEAEEGLSDMIDMNELNHATLLQNVHSRYNKNDIFTFVGPTLLVVNPFAYIEELYSNDVMQTYHSICTESNAL